MFLAPILEKIKQTPVTKGQKVAVAFSGGLDSSLAIALLRHIYEAKEIIPITIDVGQGEEEMQDMHAKAAILGITPFIIDAKEEFSQQWLSKAIQANSDYNGYPVSTSMTRQLVAKLVALKAKELECDAILEGSTGKGNDQYRMHNVFKLFAPELDILVPVRDFNLTRLEEQILCKHWNIPISEQIVGGDDKTLWCRSIASGAVDLNQPIPDHVWMWKRPISHASDEGIAVEIEFAQGIPIALNGESLPLDGIIASLNQLAGQQGIGLIDMFEDGIMDLKSREVYEAPAAHVILKLHRDLEQQCLTKDEIQFKKIVDAQWAYLVYHGLWFSPLKQALDAFIAQTQQVLGGKIRAKLYKGNIEILHRESKYSLFAPDVRSIKSASFDQRWCAHAAKIKGLPCEILAKRQEKLSKEGCYEIVG
ncbi:argininosuccinate synthase [Candidatus Protochlamydia phocaeensis]|uniref:argininosuccinate synthase n=1 Tax=Candidatus Protochlamydia phocaeensis TaxID=1414722 RepID=UPI0008399D33|nr:argininosuccinate synthase [Candidatus Protochlamydia phocaeensis]